MRYSDERLNDLSMKLDLIEKALTGKQQYGYLSGMRSYIRL